MTLFIVFAVLMILFLAATACFNAHMDVVKDHFSVSKYASSDPQWYNPAVSWVDKDNKVADKALQLKYLPFWIKWVAYLKPGWDPISDFWHWNKTKMIGSAVLCVVFAFMAGHYNPYKGQLWFGGAIFFILAGTWNGVFNLFYNHKLKK